MIEIGDALIELLEPSGASRTVEVDDSFAAPNDFAENTLYAFPTTHSFERVGTGAADGLGWGEVQERFAIRIVYATKNTAEEPQGTRERDVTVTLEAKAEEYVDKILRSQTGDQWDNLAVIVDHDFLRQFAIRGVSLVVSGYKFRSS